MLHSVRFTAYLDQMARLTSDEKEHARLISRSGNNELERALADRSLTEEPDLVAALRGYRAGRVS